MVFLPGFLFLTCTGINVPWALKLWELFMFMIQLSSWEKHGSIRFLGLDFPFNASSALPS